MTDQAKAMLELCPFCGSDAIIEEVGVGATDYVRFTVGCNSQHEAHCMGYQSLTTFDRRSDAIAAWNTRAASSAPSEAVPVAWLYETWIGGDHWSQKYSDTKPAGNKWERNIRPLYLSPVVTLINKSAQDAPSRDDIAWIIDRVSAGHVKHQYYSPSLRALAKADAILTLFLPPEGK
jgi:hypothetical protein